jgi:nucleoid-associated protein YgaU
MPLQEISNARALMEAAKNSCAKAYMPQELAEAKEKLDTIDEGTHRRSLEAKRELESLAADVQNLSKQMINQAARTKSELRDRIQEKIVAAIKRIHEGEQAEANRYARSDYLKAVERVQEARLLFQDECRYPEALEKSEEALALAEAINIKAPSFKQELEQKLPEYHIVRKGETLKSIARDSRLYGDESYWELIYKANRDQIRHPHILYPGQQLYLPKKP